VCLHHACGFLPPEPCPMGAPILMGSPGTSEPTYAQLSVRGLTRSVQGRVIHSQLSFSVSSGDTIFITGPSGVGKSLLLRTLAYLGEHAAARGGSAAAAAFRQHTQRPPAAAAAFVVARIPVDPFDAGSLTLAGKSPEEWGVPRWRALVTYVHQVCGHELASTSAASWGMLARCCLRIAGNCLPASLLVNWRQWHAWGACAPALTAQLAAECSLHVCVSGVQSRVQHKGTPAELYFALQQFKSQVGGRPGMRHALRITSGAFSRKSCACAAPLHSLPLAPAKTTAPQPCCLHCSRPPTPLPAAGPPPRGPASPSAPAGPGAGGTEPAVGGAFGALPAWLLTYEARPAGF
jgi:energy-coupling factor transporter ATP-binding protein EcfA2